MFPLFLRTVSSEAEIVVGIIQVMKQFDWSRMALITQSENIFTFVSVMLPFVVMPIYVCYYCLCLLTGILKNIFILYGMQVNSYSTST